jgi:hypothetical protein
VNYTRSARTFLAETTITSSQDEYYIVVLNRGPMEVIRTDIQVTYRVAGMTRRNDACHFVINCTYTRLSSTVTK